MQKSSISVFTGLPAKYDKPSGKDHLELIIVEGDSALGPCESARDHKRQGLFPVRGKVKNAMTCSKADFFKNEECKAIYTILACGAGRQCDPNKCPFEKIIFVSDGDIDGLHIRTLLLKMFLMYYRPLVEAGKVYTAITPLYSIKMKNNDRKFFIDDKDFVSYVFKTFSKENELRTSDNKPMKNDAVIKLLADNISYYELMGSLSKSNQAINPNVLEFIYSRLIKNIPIKTISKEVHKVYPYLDVKEYNGIVVGDGLVNDLVETAVFHEKMMDDCNTLILPFLENTDPNGYILNGQKVSLYQLMSAFHKYQPKSLTRYKGLGEMNPSELAISTIHPDYNRTLIRYTTEDIERDINEIRRIDSNMKELLEDIDTSYDL